VIFRWITSRFRVMSIRWIDRSDRLYIQLIANEMYFSDRQQIESSLFRWNLLDSIGYECTSGSLGEWEMLYSNMSSQASVSTAFWVLPNFHNCFYNSKETRNMFSENNLFTLIIKMKILFAHVIIMSRARSCSVFLLNFNITAFSMCSLKGCSFNNAFLHSNLKKKNS